MDVDSCVWISECVCTFVCTCVCVSVYAFCNEAGESDSFDRQPPVCLHLVHVSLSKGVSVIPQNLNESFSVCCLSGCPPSTLGSLPASRARANTSTSTVGDGLRLTRLLFIRYSSLLCVCNYHNLHFLSALFPGLVKLN